MKKMPLARSENLVLQDLGHELLIYDLAINKALCLNDTSAIVYRNCDGETMFDEFKTKENLSDELIFLALDQLQRENLIEGEKTSFFNGMSRREAVRKIGLASLIVLPVITSLVAPTAAHAQSAAVCSPGNVIIGGTGFFGNGSLCTCPVNTPLGGSCGQGTTAPRCRPGCTCVTFNLVGGGTCQ